MRMRMGRGIAVLGMWVLLLGPVQWYDNQLGAGRAAAQENEEYRFLRQNYADSLIQNANYPEWASYQLWLRDLVKRFFYETMKWQKEDGRIYPYLNEWRVDDEAELFLNWMPYYVLSGDEKIYTAIRKALFVYLQRVSAKLDHGYFKDAYFDTEHTLEAMILLANLTYAKPGDVEVVAALRDVVEHCPNLVTGSGYVPWFNTTTKHLRSLRPGTKEINENCPYGIDWPFNLQFAKMAMAYYYATQDVRYLNWTRDYLDGWIESIARTEREYGAPMMPWEVNPKTGALGSCSGKWYDDAFAPLWGWVQGSFESIRDSRGAFLDYYRLTRQRPYVETLKNMVNFCFSVSNNNIPAIWYQNGEWTHDNRSFCATPIAYSASLLDVEADPAYENRLLGWFRRIDYPTYDQYFWYFRRYNDLAAIQTILRRTVTSVAGNVAEFDGMTSLPADPDYFPDLEGMEGLTMTAFGGMPNDRGEMPWTEVRYFHDDNSLGLEEGVAALVHSRDDTSRVVSLFNTNATTKYVKLQADFIPKTIHSMRINQDPVIAVRSTLARVALPPEQTVRVTLYVGGRDSIPPLAAKNLRMLSSTETTIRFAWDAPDYAADGETAASYIVKRNGVELARRDSLQFTDTGLIEGTAYQYAVVSLDLSGNLSKNAVSAAFSTKADVLPPVLTAATLTDSLHVTLNFNEIVTLASVVNTANYVISPLVTVQKATLLSDRKTVVLQTMSHHDAVNYTITVSGIKDSSKAQNVMSATAFSYSYSLPVRIQNISPVVYKARKTVINDSVYIDRTYKIQSVPAFLLNQWRIVTANNDKGQTGDSFLTFAVNKHVNVYVAYDRDLVSAPSWLQKWTKTDLTVQTNDSPFICYKKYFPPGMVTIGGNSGVGSNSMYLVLLEPTTDQAPPAAPTGVSASIWSE